MAFVWMTLAFLVMHSLSRRALVRFLADVGDIFTRALDGSGDGVVETREHRTSLRPGELLILEPGERIEFLGDRLVIQSPPALTFDEKVRLHRQIQATEAFLDPAVIAERERDAKFLREAEAEVEAILRGDA